MLTPPRFVVLDDKPDHLTPIIEAFTSIGTSCIGIPYDGETDQHLSIDFYKGVRGFFIDLNLSGGSIGKNQHYAEIVRILETVITKNNGPFILILWTDNPTECPDLKVYIEESIETGYEHCKPLLIESLSKTDYINTFKEDPNFGKILPGKEDEFKTIIQNFFISCPQIATLFDWESKVFDAVNQTLIELINLIPENKRNFTDYPNEIDKVLSCITRDTVGKTHVVTDPKKAFNIAVAPILVDKILNDHPSQDNIQFWNNAITQVKTATIDSEESIGKFNKMLHLAVTNNESMGPYDWGSVIEIPSNIYTDQYCKETFGFSKKQLAKEVFCFNDEQDLVPILVRIGASCDYAQNKEGPIPYVFGFRVNSRKYKCREIDFANPELKFKSKKISDWASPLFYYESLDQTRIQPFHLVLNLQLIITAVKGKFDTYTTVYRIREQLLNQIILRTANFSSRPGITELILS
jgi:hypothetical protein